MVVPTESGEPLRTTRYFEEQVLRKRPYLLWEWIPPILASPLRRGVQDDGRMRFWGPVVDPRDGKTRYLRIVTRADGATVHNALFDRDFGKQSP